MFKNCNVRNSKLSIIELYLQQNLRMETVLTQQVLFLLKRNEASGQSTKEFKVNDDNFQIFMKLCLNCRTKMPLYVFSPHFISRQSLWKNLGGIPPNKCTHTVDGIRIFFAVCTSQTGRYKHTEQGVFN